MGSERLKDTVKNGKSCSCQLLFMRQEQTTLQHHHKVGHLKQAETCVASHSATPDQCFSLSQAIAVVFSRGFRQLRKRCYSSPEDRGVRKVQVMARNIAREGRVCWASGRSVNRQSLEVNQLLSCPQLFQES